MGDDELMHVSLGELAYSSVDVSADNSNQHARKTLRALNRTAEKLTVEIADWTMRMVSAATQGTEIQLCLLEAYLQDEARVIQLPDLLVGCPSQSPNSQIITCAPALV